MNMICRVMPLSNLFRVASSWGVFSMSTSWSSDDRLSDIAGWRRSHSWISGSGWGYAWRWTPMDSESFDHRRG